VADFLGRFRRDHSDPADALKTWLARNEDEELIWTGLTPGPSIDALSSRLSTLPGVFFDEQADLPAIAADLQLFGVDSLEADVFTQPALAVAGRRAAGAALWLWGSEDVIEPFSPALARTHADRAIAALAWRLAPVVDPTEWLVDAKRREEAARLFLLWNGQLPAGEDAGQARAIWDRLDSLTRNAALSAALADHRHRMDVLAKLQAQEAAEAAARYTHE
jgi:hypothetical protein